MGRRDWCGYKAGLAGSRETAVVETLLLPAARELLISVRASLVFICTK